MIKLIQAPCKQSPPDSDTSNMGLPAVRAAIFFRLLLSSTLINKKLQLKVPATAEYFLITIFRIPAILLTTKVFNSSVRGESPTIPMIKSPEFELLGQS